METNSNIKTMKYSEFLKLFEYDVIYSVSKKFTLNNLFLYHEDMKFDLDIIISENNYHNPIDTEKYNFGLDLNIVLREHYCDFHEKINNKIKKCNSGNFFKKNFIDTINKIEYENLNKIFDKLNSIDINSDDGLNEYFKNFIDKSFSEHTDLEKNVNVHLGIDIGDKVYLTKCLYVEDLFEGVMEGEVTSMYCSYLNFSDVPFFKPTYSFKTENGSRYDFTVNDDGSLHCSNGGWHLHRNKEDAISVKKNIINELVRKKELVYF